MHGSRSKFPVSRSPFFAPYLASNVAQVAELVVIDSGKCMPVLVAVQPPVPEL
jgi:hypothetical protein